MLGGSGNGTDLGMSCGVVVPEYLVVPGSENLSFQNETGPEGPSVTAPHTSVGFRDGDFHEASMSVGSNGHERLI